MREVVVREIEEEWRASADLVSFLASLSPELPLNIVGHGALRLRARVRDRFPSRRIRAIDAHACGAPKEAGPDIWQAGADDFVGALLPRSRTLILDPVLGSRIMGRPDLIAGIALKTFEWLILPAFVAPEPFQLFFSEEFSFEEPLFDDEVVRRWCHSTSDRPATVFVHASGGLAGRRIAFELTAGNPGTFVCRLGGQVRAFAVTSEKPTGRFVFEGEGEATPVAIAISFTGEPLRPDNPLEQRGTLYFTFGGACLEPARRHGGDDVAPAGSVLPPGGCEIVTDRSARRRLHGNGFFEVLAMGSPWTPLASLAGVRSCFDYQGGFAFRDLWPTAFATVPPRNYAQPALWYQARRTPSPGSEWQEPAARLKAAAMANLPKIRNWTIESSDRAGSRRSLPASGAGGAPLPRPDDPDAGDSGI